MSVDEASRMAKQQHAPGNDADKLRSSPRYNISLQLKLVREERRERTSESLSSAIGRKQLARSLPARRSTPLLLAPDKPF